MRFKLLIVVAFILASSCSRVLTPALYHQDIAYQPKPTSFDTTKTAAYISAGLNRNLGIEYEDILTSGQANLSIGHRCGNFNIAYGTFGVFGNYKSANTTVKTDYFSDKFFGAIGGRFSVNTFVTSDNVDFRFIGVEMAYSHEFGEYVTYRHSLFKQGSNFIDAADFVDPRTNLYTVGFTTEVIFHGGSNTGNINFQHGIRGFFGTTLGHNILKDNYFPYTYIPLYYNRLFPKASYFVTFKNFFGTAEIGNNFFLRFGYKF